MLRAILDDLGIAPDYASTRNLPIHAEAQTLVSAGPNIMGREQQLTKPAAAAWLSMQAKALTDGVNLLLVSGYRSFDYQAGLIRRKLDAGQSLSEILSVNAPPGCSEHHTGRAVDIATPGQPPLSEAFELTDAFDWLSKNAGTHGFSMSYPRSNMHGFIYEPWHWCFAEDL